MSAQLMKPGYYWVRRLIKDTRNSQGQWEIARLTYIDDYGYGDGKLENPEPSWSFCDHIPGEWSPGYNVEFAQMGPRVEFQMPIDRNTPEEYRPERVEG